MLLFDITIFTTYNINYNVLSLNVCWLIDYRVGCSIFRYRLQWSVLCTVLPSPSWFPPIYFFKVSARLPWLNMRMIIIQTRYNWEKKYPYNCFVMTMYQSLLMALVSLPICVLKNWDLKKCNYNLSTQIFEVLLQDFKWWLPRVWNLMIYCTYLLKILA